MDKNDPIVLKQDSQNVFLFKESSGESKLNATNKLDGEIKKYKRVVLMWHYNLTGAYSEWIPDAEKKALLDFLDHERERIICICVGHWHISEQRSTPQGILEISGSGDYEIMVCDVDVQLKMMTVKKVCF